MKQLQAPCAGPAPVGTPVAAGFSIFKSDHGNFVVAAVTSDAAAMRSMHVGDVLVSLGNHTFTPSDSLERAAQLLDDMTKAPTELFIIRRIANDSSMRFKIPLGPTDEMQRRRAAHARTDFFPKGTADLPEPRSFHRLSTEQSDNIGDSRIDVLDKQIFKQTRMPESHVAAQYGDAIHLLPSELPLHSHRSAQSDVSAANSGKSIDMSDDKTEDEFVVKNLYDAVASHWSVPFSISGMNRRKKLQNGPAPLPLFHSTTAHLHMPPDVSSGSNTPSHSPITTAITAATASPDLIVDDTTDNASLESNAAEDAQERDAFLGSLDQFFNPGRFAARRLIVAEKPDETASPGIATASVSSPGIATAFVSSPGIATASVSSPGIATASVLGFMQQQRLARADAFPVERSHNDMHLAVQQQAAADSAGPALALPDGWEGEVHTHIMNLELR